MEPQGPLAEQLSTVTPDNPTHSALPCSAAAPVLSIPAHHHINTHSAPTRARHFLGEAGFSALSSSLGDGHEASPLPLLKTALINLHLCKDGFELSSAELLSSQACTALSAGG